MHKTNKKESRIRKVNISKTREHISQSTYTF